MWTDVPVLNSLTIEYSVFNGVSITYNNLLRFKFTNYGALHTELERIGIPVAKNVQSVRIQFIPGDVPSVETQGIWPNGRL
jgi:hypothetical protein